MSENRELHDNRIQDSGRHETLSDVNSTDFSLEAILSEVYELAEEPAAPQKADAARPAREVSPARRTERASDAPAEKAAAEVRAEKQTAPERPRRPAQSGSVPQKKAPREEQHPRSSEPARPTPAQPAAPANEAWEPARRTDEAQESRRDDPPARREGQERKKRRRFGLFSAGNAPAEGGAPEGPAEDAPTETALPQSHISAPVRRPRAENAARTAPRAAKEDEKPHIYSGFARAARETGPVSTPSDALRTGRGAISDAPRAAGGPAADAPEREASPADLHPEYFQSMFHTWAEEDGPAVSAPTESAPRRGETGDRVRPRDARADTAPAGGPKNEDNAPERAPRRPRPVLTPTDGGKKGGKNAKAPKPARTKRPAEPAGKEAEENPSAWVEPSAADLPPVLIEMAVSPDDNSRPDGYLPPKPKVKKLRQAAISREGQEEAPDEELPIDPELKGKKRRFADLLDRADAYADAMFSDAEDHDEEARRAEKYIPGTDEEATAAPKKRRRRRKAIPPAEDYSPRTMSGIYVSGLNFMSWRMFFLLFLSVVSTCLALGQAGYFPLAKTLRAQPVLLDACMLWLLGCAIALTLDVIWMGISDALRGLPGLHTLVVAAVLVTLADAVGFLFTQREGPFPYCAPAVVLLCALLWGAYDKKLGNYRASRLAAAPQHPQRITLDEEKWNARDTFAKSSGGTDGFGRQIQAPDGVQTIFRFLVPIALAAAVVLAFLSSVGRGHPGRFFWCLSAILTAASPLSALLAYGQPWLRLTRRLEKAGAAVAGWPGIRCASGSRGALIADFDLFPMGTIQFDGIKVYGNIPLEKLAGCAASLVLHSGSDLALLFDGLLRNQGGFYRRVDDFQTYESGGLSGTIRGEQVLVGSASFMSMMDVPLPQGLSVKHAVFCAIDGALRGVFALRYNKTDSIRTSTLSLLREGVVPVLVPRDGNVTPAMLRNTLRLPVERMEYPPIERRFELTEPEQEHGQELCALLSRDSLEGYAEAVVGCRRLKRAVRLNTMLAFAASLCGLVLGYFLTFTNALFSLSPVNVLAYLVLWLIPSVLVSRNVTKY